MVCRRVVVVFWAAFLDVAEGSTVGRPSRTVCLEFGEQRAPRMGGWWGGVAGLSPARTPLPWTLAPGGSLRASDASHPSLLVPLPRESMCRWAPGSGAAPARAYRLMVLTHIEILWGLVLR